jgi:hypothetical protein
LLKLHEITLSYRVFKAQNRFCNSRKCTEDHD